MEAGIVKRVNITLPKVTLKKIDTVAKRGDRSRFIADAVNFYIDSMSRKNIREALKEGSLVRAKRDRAIASEWFELDSEVWRKK